MRQRVKQQLNFKGFQASDSLLDGIMTKVQAWLQLKFQGQDQPAISYIDAYSSRKLTATPQCYNPIFPSLGAMFPFGLTERGTACRENRMHSIAR
jgi:hypothetical protein